MSEIEKLRRERAELNKKIKAILTQETVNGKAQLLCYPKDGAPDEWRLRVKSERGQFITERWVSIYTDTDKEKTIAAIDRYINDLQGLKEKL